MRSRAVDVEAARRAFPDGNRRGPAWAAVRPQVLASWERSRRAGIDAERLGSSFVGYPDPTPPVVTCAADVLDDADPAGSSLLLLDVDGVVRVRRDGDRVLGALLDDLGVVPGHGVGELDIGTSAASVALHERTDTELAGAEHYHLHLTCLAEAAALVTDPHDHEIAGVVVVVRHDQDGTPLQRSLARLLADRVAGRMAGDRQRSTAAIFAAFDDRCAPGGEWVLAGDGATVLTNGPCRALDPGDQSGLTDVLLAGFALGEYGERHVDLPSGVCAEIELEPVRLDGRLVGCLLHGAKARAGVTVTASEAVRRQGSHVAPTTRRDYAQDLRAAAREHAEARVRANRELLSPYLRARHQVVANIRQGRNHLLIGEPGVGKRTLAVGRFRETFPTGRVVRVHCASFATDPAPLPAPSNPGDERPCLVVLDGLGGLGPVGARRLDEALRMALAMRRPPLVIGCVDEPTVDATRPYGLLLRHFHEVTRVPALRYRADEIGEIALSVLRRLAGRRSLRLSLQVIRVLEGYAWPGNISELEDVLRFVLARKPLGEVQPPDLPQLCFQGRSRRLSMLEAAQCDAIIQALYEAQGNRYKAAAMLGIARSSLYRKIDAFGISYIA